MINFEETLSQYPDLSERLTQYEPIKTAASIAGLQTMPAMQAYDFRTLTLICLVLAVSRGTQTPSNADLDSWLAELGEGICGWLEDPPEDVSVYNICTEGGNRRVIEGSWDLSGFHLQRFVDVLEHMPAGDFFDHLRKASFALLSLSEAVAARANAARFTSIDDDPRDKQKSAEFGRATELGALVEFSKEQLQQLEIVPEHLDPFLVSIDQLDDLKSGDIVLERCPVVAQQDSFLLLLPNSVSVAVRLFVIDALQKAGLLSQLHKALASSYGALLKETPVLGEHFNLPIRFSGHDGLGLAQVAYEVDRGKWISLLVIVDNFDGFRGSLLASGPNGKIEKTLAACIDESQKRLLQSHNVEDGIHFIVSCGWGRPLAARLPQPSPNWRTVHASAADLVTISLLPRMKSLDLWRLLDAEDQLRAEGVHFQNASGLLNLYAFWQKTRFHLLPQFEGSDSRLFDLVGLPTDSLRGPRKQVLAGFDERMVRDIHGKFLRVRRKTIDAFFEDIDESRLSISLTDIQERLHGVVESNKGRAWWCEVECDSAARHERYKHWKAASSWLSRAVDKLEEHFSLTLPNGAILWRIVLEGTGIQSQSPRGSGESRAKDLLDVTGSESPNIVQVTAKPEFYRLWNDPKNVAERGLVTALVEGVVQLANAEWDGDQVEALTSEIVPNADARYTHAFSVPQFSDYFSDQLQSNTRISAADEVYVQHGLAWKSGVERSTRTVASTDECLRLLKQAVLSQWTDIKTALNALDRTSVLQWLLVNHEALGSDQLQWQRTMRALLGLYAEQNPVIEIATDYLASIAASTLACRLLIEMAVSDCPEADGNQPGQLELSRLLAKTLSIFNLGGWSDAIHDQILDAEIEITPVGEIIPKSDLADTVMRPLGTSLQSAILNRAAAGYEKYYQFEADVPETAAVFESEFLEALSVEYGSSLDDLRLTIDALEQKGIERKSPVFALSKMELIKISASKSSVPQNAIETLLDRFVTQPRPTWAEPPDSFVNNDIKTLAISAASISDCATHNSIE